MSEETVVQIYDIAENDRGELLVAVFDLGQEVTEATYVFDGKDIVLSYDDGRVVRLPNVPAPVHPVLGACKQILITEASDDSLVRAYDARNISMPPVRRGGGLRRR